MIGKRFVIIAGVVAVWAMGSVTAHAFEQQAPAAPISVPADPVVSLDEKVNESQPQKKGKGFKLPGIGKLSIPKFNFGLDLMYGTPETSETYLGFSSDPAGEDDVTIMGKVKRRF
jgi:hypothetical protein